MKETIEEQFETNNDLIDVHGSSGPRPDTGYSFTVNGLDPWVTS